MADPFISRERRVDLLSYLASDASQEAADPRKPSFDKSYTKEQKEQKENKESKESKERKEKEAKEQKEEKEKRESKDNQKDYKDEERKDNDFVSVGPQGRGQIVRAVGGDAVGADEAIAKLSVGQKWVKPAELMKHDPVV